ncbi:MAG: LPS export ABC transporter permease LptG [Legionellaceae bacterium]|nr:LPS export ABC transporter permease LptG [Legionellaceae bacterium]|tara:strand:- start:4498 stop:5559 length:1062 start_codon:yes stop_codon:yes gene_type:complete
MKRLDRYIAQTVLSSMVLVTLMLAGLQIFMLFVSQLDDLGRANFHLGQVILYVLSQMPYQVYLFFPMASLLGSLIGLGLLANHRELIVMRAAGVSILRITLAVLKVAMILVLIVTALGESVVPKLAYWGHDLRLHALSYGQALRTAQGVWLRYNHDYMFIQTILPGNVLNHVYQFHFDKHDLTRIYNIERITFERRHWQAYGVQITELKPNQIKSVAVKKMLWPVNIKPGMLNANNSEPDEMTLQDLYRYVHAQKKSHSAKSLYQLAFWQRIFQPLTTCVMMLLAIPFIFGPLRSSTMGSKLLVGAVTGFSFYLVSRFFGPLSQVLQWSPVTAVIAPIIIFAGFAAWLMRQVR